MTNDPKAEVLREHSFVVEESLAGLRLDQAMRERFPRFTRALWKERILQGFVSVNGAAARPSRNLKIGDVIQYIFSAKEEPPVNRAVEIIYEDADILVLNKPANLPVHPSGAYFRNTLYFWLKERFGDEFHCGFAHRLDRETSGLLVAAKSPEHARTLQTAFQSGQVEKEYRVIVEGRFPEALVARGWIFPDPDSPLRRKQAFSLERPDSSLARTAHTEFRRLHQSAEIALLAAQLFTGRMHQIRATLCSLGFPVVGDRMYGADPTLYMKHIQDAETDADRARLRLGRTALHAARLKLPHPRTQERLVLVAPLPADMAALAPDDSL